MTRASRVLRAILGVAMLSAGGVSLEFLPHGPVRWIVVSLLVFSGILSLVQARAGS